MAEGPDGTHVAIVAMVVAIKKHGLLSNGRSRCH